MNIIEHILAISNLAFSAYFIKEYFKSKRELEELKNKNSTGASNVKIKIDL